MDPDPASIEGTISCFLFEFTAGSVVNFTLTFKPSVAQNLSVSGIVLPQDGLDPPVDVIVDNNEAYTCMNMVSWQTWCSLS
jgi:hypothetical protein